MQCLALMDVALFINGVFESVLLEIIAAQDERDGGQSYLQPYKGGVIKCLKKNIPSAAAPMRLYISTTKNLSNICYVAEIVGWEDKRAISQERRQEIRSHLEHFQPGEVALFDGVGDKGKKAINLTTIQNLRKLDSLLPTSVLIKVSDRRRLEKRSRSGGWSPVFDLGDLLQLPVETRRQYEDDLGREVRTAEDLSDAGLAARLAQAPKVPQRIQIISTGFRRNAAVIVAALRRAKGLCEKCHASAPFARRSDGSPYLEVHHWKPLSEGGEDTLENAAALCPNCHRQAHHG